MRRSGEGEKASGDEGDRRPEPRPSIALDRLCAKRGWGVTEREGSKTLSKLILAN